MNPEVYSYLIPKLIENGARDAFMTSIMMKKGRPAVKLEVIVNKSNLPVIEQLIFRETTTLGLRKHNIDRSTLRREFKKINNVLGEFTVKLGYLDGEVIRCTPEYEECARAANDHDLPLNEVYRIVNQTISEQFQQSAVAVD